jgi:hypothetical protein
MMESWAEGWIAAMNGIGAMAGDGPGVAATESDGFWGYLDNYCSTHPLDHFYVAVASLVRELDRRSAAEKGLPHTP